MEHAINMSKVTNSMVFIGKSKGFNLIELLVSLVVVALSLFAVAKIQIMGLQSGESAKQSTASTVNVVNLMERFDAHRVGIGSLLAKNKGTVTFFLNKNKFEGVNCNNFAIGFDDTDGSGVPCEIDAWIYSVWNSLNLQNDDDICAKVTIKDVPGFKYKTGMKYKIPKVMVDYKWRKTPSSSANLNCVKDGERLPPPVYSTNVSVDQSAEIGYSTMEYLLP